jgi:predicted RNA methylase
MAKAKTDTHKTQKELIDDAYFAGYSKPAIHKDMLDDATRVDLYKEAIDFTCKGKTVLDLGCGSGVLSGFAVQKGAKEVIGVDNADVKKIMAKKLKEMGVDS